MDKLLPNVIDGQMGNDSAVTLHPVFYCLVQGCTYYVVSHSDWCIHVDAY